MAIARHFRFGDWLGAVVKTDKIMICEYCGGNVIWMGPLTNLTHTQCQKCKAVNCQVVDVVVLESDTNEEILREANLRAHQGEGAD